MLFVLDAMVFSQPFVFKTYSIPHYPLQEWKIFLPSIKTVLDRLLAI